MSVDPSGAVKRLAGRACVAIAGLCALVALSASARADEASGAKCVEAAYHAQELRDHGRLREARAALLTCAAPTCPAVVERDCRAWLSDVDERLPMIVVAVVDPDGHD